MVVTFSPQCGQNVIVRPAGSTSLQERHRSPACGTTDRRVMGGSGSGAEGDAATGAATGVGVRVAGDRSWTGRSAVRVTVALGRLDRGGPSSGPIARLCSADGDSVMDADANFLNALGSGLVDASSAHSASRMRSSTIR